jgi:hypothetical protein
MPKDKITPEKLESQAVKKDRLDPYPSQESRAGYTPEAARARREAHEKRLKEQEAQRNAARAHQQNVQGRG